MTHDDLEIIYVLKNEAMPGLLKIGRTRDLVGRISQLSSTTAIPLPFSCAYAARVTDAAFVEQQLHIAFAPHRVSPSREFFTAPLPSVVAAIRLVAVAPVTVGSEGAAVVDRASENSYQSVSEPHPLSGVISKEEALADLHRLLASGSSYSAQRELCERWGRSRSTVSDWFSSWEETGVIPQRTNAGKCTVIRIGDTATPHKLYGGDLV